MYPWPYGSIAPETDISHFIAAYAKALGIDPATALRVAMSEGGVTNPVAQSNYTYQGVREQSFGPFQLNVQGGLGNSFQSQTGLDPRMPANWQVAVAWTLNWVKQHGWDPGPGGGMHGATGQGITNWQGVTQGGPGLPLPSAPAPGYEGGPILPPPNPVGPGVVPPDETPPTEGVTPNAGSIGDAIGSGFGSALSGLAQNTIGQGGIINQKLPEILLGLMGVVVIIIALIGFATNTGPKMAGKVIGTAIKTTAEE